MKRWAAILLLTLTPLAWAQSTMTCLTPAEAKKTYGIEARGIHYTRQVSTEGVSGIRAVLVDDIAIVAKTRTVTMPAIVSGAVDALGSDQFRFAAKKGRAISVEAFAARLGSRLDPVVRVLDSDGKELARCDDDPAGASPDSRIDMKLPADGEYVIEIRDAAYEGSPEHRYFLRIADGPLPRPQPPSGPAEAEPNDSRDAATSLTSSISGGFHSASDVDHFRIEGKRGERIEVRAATRSIGWPCDVVLKLVSPDGATLAQSKPTDADDGVVTHRFAEAGQAIVVVRELTQQSGPAARYRLTRGPARPSGVTLAVDADFVNAAPGAEITLKVTATRKDAKAAITLTIPGFEVAGNVIADGKTETQLRVKVPQDIDPNVPHILRIEGRLKGDDVPIPVTTTTALKRSFPKLLSPPPELTDVVTLGIKRKPD